MHFRVNENWSRDKPNRNEPTPNHSQRAVVLTIFGISCGTKSPGRRYLAGCGKVLLLPLRQQVLLQYGPFTDLTVPFVRLFDRPHAGDFPNRCELANRSRLIVQRI